MLSCTERKLNNCTISGNLLNYCNVDLQFIELIGTSYQYG